MENENDAIQRIPPAASGMPTIGRCDLLSVSASYPPDRQEPGERPRSRSPSIPGESKPGANSRDHEKTPETLEDCRRLRAGATPCGEFNQAEGTGVEPATGKPAPDFESSGDRENRREHTVFSEIVAPELAVEFDGKMGAAQANEKPPILDADLAWLVACWTRLDSSARACILAVAKTCENVAREHGAE